MGTVTFQFSGRFVFAQRDGAGTLDVLAVDVDSADREATGQLNAATSDRHRMLLSLPRLNFVPASLASTPPPNPHYRVLTAQSDAEMSEHVVWDLTGWNVTVEATGRPFEWQTEGTDIVDLLDLEARRNRRARLDSQHIEHDTPQVSGRIRFSTGQGRAKSLFAKLYEFSAPGAPSAYDGPLEFADFVTVDVEADGIVRLHLVARDGAQPARVIEVSNRRTSGNAMVGMTNMCSRVPVSNDDREFAAFYRLLDPSTGEKDGFIPLASARGGEIGDCMLMARAAY
jgi:hypothetical protein